MKKKLVRFVFKMALLGLSLSMVYAFLPPRMGTVEALKLGFSAAVLVTGVLFFLDRAIFFLENYSGVKEMGFKTRICSQEIDGEA